MSERLCLSTYNRIELGLPQWLTFDFFIGILKKFEPNSVLKQTFVESSEYFSNNFRSEMYLCDIFYFDAAKKSKSKVIIIKVIVNDEIYAREVDMWFKILPKMEATFEAVGDKTKFGPRCICHQRIPVKFLMFEQLDPKEYEAFNGFPEFKPLDMSIHLIAKWHAASYKLAKEEPSLFEKFQHNVILPAYVLKSVGLKHFIKVLDKYPKLKEFKSYFQALYETDFLQEIKDILLEFSENKQADVLYALCHGDFHVSNLKFKGNDDARFNDFQSAYMGPMVNDIIFSTTMSFRGGPPRRIAKNTVVFQYYSRFEYALRSIKFTGEIPKFIDFKKQLLKYKKFDFYVIYTLLPVWVKCFEENDDPDRNPYSKEYRNEIYNDKTYIKIVESILTEFLHLGYFED